VWNRPIIVFMLLLWPSVGLSALMADWRFDEYGWRALANELVDFSGNGRHGRSSEIINYTTEGALCGAADLTRSSATDYFSLNRDVLNGKSNFSIAIWGKLPSSVTSHQALFSAAASNSPNEILLEFSYSERRLKMHFNGRYFAFLENYFPNDNQWHQYIWVRRQGDHCLYIDGQSYGCINPNDSSYVGVDVNGLAAVKPPIRTAMVIRSDSKAFPMKSKTKEEWSVTCSL
jgi:MSHA biogenesis protein MshQ